MSVHTRTRRTKTVRAAIKRRKTKPKRKSIPWREAFKEEIEKYSEAGMMLRAHRHSRKITQKALAEAIGVSQHHISEMENGKRSIGKEIAKRIGEYFKKDYRRFL